MPDPAKTVELLSKDPTALAREDVLAGITSAEELRSWIAAREGRFARRLDELPADPSDPAKDLAGTLERNQNVGRGEAKRRKDRAEQLDHLPATDEALEQGEITDGHADAMARARSKADATAKAALEANEARLLEDGRKESPHEFAKRLERFVQRHSADDGRDQWDKNRGRRRLSLAKDGDGMTRISGLLDPEAAQRIRRALLGVSEELFRRDHQDHPVEEPVPFLERTSEQRLADALEEVCARAEGTKGPATNDDRAVVLLPYDDLVSDDGPNAATLADGTPVPASVARRVACDAGLIPAVLDGQGCVLDLGRSQRIASPSQRLALKLMWESCSFADCRSPFEWCQIHHTIPFNDDGALGKTDLGELTPLCRHCHDLAHTRGWTITKNPADHSTLTIAPDGTTLAPPARPAPTNRAAPRGGDRTGPQGAPAATLFTPAA